MQVGPVPDLPELRAGVEVVGVLRGVTAPGLFRGVGKMAASPVMRLVSWTLPDLQMTSYVILLGFMVTWDGHRGSDGGRYN